MKKRLNPQEAAELIGCSYGHLMKLVRKGKIPHIRYSNRVFFFEETLVLWMENLERQSVQQGA
ncbi:helix-turn-helix domain-containing protein [Lutispora sp.]|uniref:helix-turn-helix domain-containing protein n=1 Tax=Lutispora sp. TaxID=2828727 RepID=UPI003567EB2F